MKALNYLYVIAGCCTIASCQQNQNQNTKAATAAVAAKPGPQQPFRFHKLIEVAPGMDYDVFSWGRGPLETGAYMILRSDSVDKKYTTITGDLDGKIIDVFNTDLDTDGNPEIFIQSQTADSSRYDKIDAYEYNDDGARKLDFPKLTTKQKKGYHGGDDFTVKEGKLVRTYDIYDSDNSNAKPTGQKRTLEYSYHSNDFSVKQVSTDSTNISSSKPVKAAETAPEPAKPASTESRHETHRSRHHRESRHREERHHEVERHRKAAHHKESSRRHHRHRR